MVDAAIAAIELFNEKTEKLLRLSFIKSMMEPNTGITLSWRLQEDGNYAQNHVRRGPQEEAIDAFVLSFRFFIQDNERSSFRNMEEYYRNAPIHDDLRNELIRVRKELNDFLDMPTRIRIEYNNEVLTNRRVMDIFIYGGMAHSKDIKRQIYKGWMDVPPFKPLIENEFVNILSSVLSAIEYIKILNDQALTQLKLLPPA